MPEGQVMVAGVSFTGNQGVSRVELSYDGGRSWRAAHLKPPRSAYAWVLWADLWKAPRGRHTIVARCVDGQGRMQPRGPKPQAPDHAEGWHTVRVDVH